MHSSKRAMLSARIASFYAYDTYHTRMVIPYAYGIQNCTIRVRYIPYAYGMYHTRMVQNIGTKRNEYLRSFRSCCVKIRRYRRPYTMSNIGCLLCIPWTTRCTSSSTSRIYKIASTAFVIDLLFSLRLSCLNGLKLDKSTT